MATLSLQSLKVAVDGGEEDGLLVFHRAVLVAVLVCLDEPNYGDDQGHWHLEIGFGPCSARSTTFPDLATALGWIARRVGAEPDEAVMCAQTHFAAKGRPTGA